MANITGIVFYRGPSLLDGKPIVAIATLKTENPKTGPMIQTWILRADVSPRRAIDTGADASVCGNCPHRGRIDRVGQRKVNKGRTCYVAVRNAPLAVWKAWKKGRYERLDMARHAELFAGRNLRMGSYGDPVAVPLSAWRLLLDHCNKRTGYTHQWRDCSPEWRGLVMASVDSASERLEAKAQGWRTFRVRQAGESLETREVVCPASPEGGNRRTCDTCAGCKGGTAQTDFAIVAHGGAAIMAGFRKMSLQLI